MNVIGQFTTWFFFISFLQVILPQVRFPIKEVFKQNISFTPVVNISGRLIFNFPPRQEFDKYLCQGERSCCDCSESCMKRQTCCIDKHWNESRPLYIDDYLRDFLLRVNSYKKVLCTPVIENVGNQFSMNPVISSYLMVASCLENSSSNFKEGCINPIQRSTAFINPVLGTDGYIYRNSYCALCNDVTSFELSEMTSTCDVVNGSDVSNGTAVPEYCSVDIFREKPFDLMAYSCDMNSFDESDCPISSPFYQMCSAFKGQIDFSMDERYKNIFCYYCKKNKTEKVKLDCQAQTWEPGTYSLSQTLSLTQNRVEDGREYHFSKAFKCGHNQVYNFVTRACETMDCPLLPSKCNSNMEMFNRTCDENLWISFATYLLLPSNVFNGTLGVQLQALSNNLFQSKSSIPKLKLENHSSSLLAFSRTNLQIDVYISQHKVSNNSFYHDNVLRSFYNGKVCANFTINKSRVVGFPKCFSVASRAENYVLHIRNGSIEEILISCEEFHEKPKCIHTGVVNWLSKNGSHVKFNDPQTGKVVELSAQEFIPLSNGIAYCIIKTDDIFADVRTAEYYISLTGTYMSILCYIVIIFTFTYFRKLRTVPNCNNVGACAMLLISDILFLLATQADNNHTLCKAVGVLLHASLLSVQCWVIIISVDISRKIRSMSSLQNGFKILRYYITLGVVSPFFLVLILFLLDQKNIITVNYGSNNFCWINELVSRLLFYIVPCIAVFFFSLTMFVSNMYTIAKVKNETKKMMGSSESNFKELSILAFKLIIILGLSEFIGFIQIPNSGSSTSVATFNAVFSILYAILRSFRGVCIALVYLLNKQTVKLYRDKMFPSSSMKTSTTFSRGKFKDSRL